MRSNKEKRRRKKFGFKKQRRYRRFWRRICEQKYLKILEMARYLTRWNDDLARELAHNVILRLLKYSPCPVAVENFDGYIFRTTRNTWISTLRVINGVGSGRGEADPETPEPAPLDRRLIDVLSSEKNLASLAGSADSVNNKLEHTKILLMAGYKFPAIARILAESVYKTKYRWYKHLRELKKAMS
jgi:DNA-directed RNA polymerase specialized sigma24 family protein